MSLIQFAGGRVYDPRNNVHGDVRDLWVLGKKIVAAPPDAFKPQRVINVQGRVLMPGGVDAHSHVCGQGVNDARHLQLGLPRTTTGHPDVIRRRGPQQLIPTVAATGELYSGLGYTTVIDAAIPPSNARGAHLELSCLPGPQKAFLTLTGNHPYALGLIQKGEQDRLQSFCAWLLAATRAYGMKVVNPGGVANWSSGNEGMLGVDDEVVGYGITPRTIIAQLAEAADALKLPHAIHLHCNRLGLPGNWTTTLESMKAFEGRRGHLTHVQFQSYGGDPNDPTSMCSGSEPLIDYWNAHRNLTVDVGQVLFGDAMSLTGDLAAADYLRRLLRSKSFSMRSGCDGGCGVMPLRYKDTSFVHALQWAVGLEWFLRAEDLWRLALSTDHPNGGAFVSYPEIIALLMSETYRSEVLKKLPEKVRERSALAGMKREYTLSEIAVITRAAPARILGLQNKGHLGEGADADICVYSPNDDKREMFALPYLVMRGGEIVLEDGEIRNMTPTSTLYVSRAYDHAAIGDVHDWVRDELCISPANFPIQDRELLANSTEAV